MSSGVNDEPVLQEGKSKESIDHSRSVFSTPTIPTGNQVTKSVNKPHYPKSFGNGGVVLNSELDRQSITLEFTLHFRTNNLIPLKELTKRQIVIHKLIQFMHKEGMGYRRISDFLNRSGIKTHTGKTWSNSKVHANLKRMQERQERIAFRNKTYPSFISGFRIK